MRAGVADPADAIDAADRTEQLGEQRANSHRLAGLPAGQREVAAVGVHVLPEQGHLGDAVGGQGSHLVHDVVEAAADLPSPHRRHDAERAGVVAADLDGDPGRVGHLTPSRQRAGERLVVVGGRLLQDLDDRPARRALLAQELGGPVHVVGAEHDVDVGRLVDDEVAVLLGQAAADHDLHVGPPLLEGLELTEVAVELVVGVLADAAGVEHHHVGIVDAGGRAQAVGLEQAGDALGVVLVHLAPEGAHHVRLVGHPRGPRSRGTATSRRPFGTRPGYATRTNCPPPRFGGPAVGDRGGR